MTQTIATVTYADGMFTLYYGADENAEIIAQVGTLLDAGCALVNFASKDRRAWARGRSVSHTCDYCGEPATHAMRADNNGVILAHLCSAHDRDARYCGRYTETIKGA